MGATQKCWSSIAVAQGQRSSGGCHLRRTSICCFPVLPSTFSPNRFIPPGKRLLYSAIRWALDPCLTGGCMQLTHSSREPGDQGTMYGRSAQAARRTATCVHDKGPPSCLELPQLKCQPFKLSNLYPAVAANSDWIKTLYHHCTGSGQGITKPVKPRVKVYARAGGVCSRGNFSLLSKSTHEETEPSMPKV